MASRVNRTGFESDMADLELVQVDEEGLEQDQDSSIPISDEKVLKELVTGLQGLYEDYTAQAREQWEDWTKWRRQVKPRPEQAVKDWPFPKSSNVEVPVLRMLLNTIFGKLIGIFGVRPDKRIWRIRALRDIPEEKQQAEVIEKYLDIVGRQDMSLKKKLKTVLKEAGLIGKCWVKVPWVTKRWNFKRSDGSQVTATIKEGPDFVVIPPEDVLFDQVWTNLEDIPVLFQDVTLPWSVLEERVAEGIYEDVLEDLKKWVRTSPDGGETARAERDNIHLADTEVWDITECRVLYDVDEDGVSEDIILTVHMPSGIVLRQGFNDLGIREFECVGFIHEPFSIGGSGVGDSASTLQEEATAIHNMRNDNMKVANMKMLAVKKTSGLEKKESIYPGKIWWLNDPQNDLKEISLGEVYPSSERAEQLTINYAQRSAGISEIDAGFSDSTLKSRDTARGQMFRSQQSGGIFQSIVDDVADSLSKIGQLVFFQLVRNRERVLELEEERKRLTPEELVLLSQALQIPLEEVPVRLSFSIQAADIDQTFEAKRQTLMMLAQLWTQFSEKTMPLVMQIFGPEGQQMMQQAPDAYGYMVQVMAGSIRMMQKIFEFSDVTNTEDYLPDVKKFDMLEEAIEVFAQGVNQMGGMIPQTGGMNDATQTGGPGPGQEGGGIPGGAGPAPGGNPALG